MKLKIISTTYLKGLAETVITESEFCEDKSGVERGLINIYPEVKWQKFSGFGGAFTEASATLCRGLSGKFISP